MGAKSAEYQRKVYAARRGQLCVHCSKRKCTRPRGLCWPCYYTPGVPALYPPTSKYARRGVGNEAGYTQPLPEPTTAAPGTPEKEAVLAARAAAGLALHHPDDARRDDGRPAPREPYRCLFGGHRRKLMGDEPNGTAAG